MKRTALVTGASYGIGAAIAEVLISLSSTHAIIGVAAVSAYGVSKAGISQMTRMLAIEWAERLTRLPHGALVVELMVTGEDLRTITIAPPRS